jgi:hypothetical protein
VEGAPVAAHQHRHRLVPPVLVERAVHVLEGDVPGDEVVGEDSEGGAHGRRRPVAPAVAHQVVHVRVGVVVKVDVRVPGAVAYEQDETFLLWDGHLLPATTTTSTYQHICSA